MASEVIFVNPEEVRTCATTISSISARMKSTFDDMTVKIRSTQESFESESAEAMREKFNALAPEFERFEKYLTKISNYLTQNVAEPVEITESVSKQNVASIRKPV